MDFFQSCQEHYCYYIGKYIDRKNSNKSRSKFLMLPHPLSSFEIPKYYQNELEFSGVCSRNNFSKMKDGAYMTNLDEYELIRIHWVVLYVNAESVTLS